MQHIAGRLSSAALVDFCSLTSECDTASDRRQRLLASADAVAAVAAAWADEVDRDGRFPDEAVSALRTERLLSAMLPAELGGMDASVSDIVNVCYRLGRACAATAMIFAMHQSSVACLLRHGRGQFWQEALLLRIASEQLLVASSTTEGKSGGNVRSSAAAIEQDETGIRLERDATVISYGAQAGVILTTARRRADAAASDQVLVAFVKSDYTLEQTGGWNSLGMRGTCSGGYNLKAAGYAAQILTEPYDRIHAQSMVPVAHLAWSGAWAGIAAGALERARAFTRRSARQSNGNFPPGAAHVTDASARLQNLRALIATSARSYANLANDPRALMSLDFQAEINLLKVQASEMAVSIVLAAARACGLAGYRNDSEFSVGRHLRDVLSAPIMISNDRILANLAATSLLAAVPDLVCE